MAKSDTTEKATSTDSPVIKTNDHDRIVAPSVRNDGTLDQTNPEFIGDKEASIAAVKEQFAQIAVSAVDADRRSELGLAGSTDDGDTSDKQIDKLKAEHDKAAAAAESKAEALVNALHKG